MSGSIERLANEKIYYFQEAVNFPRVSLVDYPSSMAEYSVSP